MKWLKASHLIFLLSLALIVQYFYDAVKFHDQRLVFVKYESALQKITDERDGYNYLLSKENRKVDRILEEKADLQDKIRDHLLEKIDLLKKINSLEKQLADIEASRESVDK